MKSALVLSFLLLVGFAACDWLVRGSCRLGFSPFQIYGSSQNGECNYGDSGLYGTIKCQDENTAIQTVCHDATCQDCFTSFEIPLNTCNSPGALFYNQCYKQEPDYRKILQTSAYATASYSYDNCTTTAFKYFAPANTCVTTAGALQYPFSSGWIKCANHKLSYTTYSDKHCIWKTGNETVPASSCKESSGGPYYDCFV